MSLNGLDDAKVVEAHEFAAAELGGWYGFPIFSSQFLFLCSSERAIIRVSVNYHDDIFNSSCLPWRLHVADVELP